jgi:hypothetical protein
VYKLRSLNLSLTVGREAAKRGVKCFVELSTGMVYKPDSSPSKENDKLKPWSKIAVFKLQAEEELAKIEGYVVDHTRAGDAKRHILTKSQAEPRHRAAPPRLRAVRLAVGRDGALHGARVQGA